MKGLTHFKLMDLNDTARRKEEDEPSEQSQPARITERFILDLVKLRFKVVKICGGGYNVSKWKPFIGRAASIWYS